MLALLLVKYPRAMTLPRTGLRWRLRMAVYSAMLVPGCRQQEALDAVILVVVEEHIGSAASGAREMSKS